MLRDKNLAPLSRQHQHALALCVRIVRAWPIGDTELDAWQAEAAQQFEGEIAVHFTAEEAVVFPAAKRLSAEMDSLVNELLVEHGSLREDFAQAQARKMSAQDLHAFAQRLSSHIRKEERQLFQGMQQNLQPEELAVVGVLVEDKLKDATGACMLPAQTTRLRAKT